jgi:hypothetical protein
MPFKKEDIPAHNMIPKPEHFLMFYEKYDEKTDSDVWRFIELSIGHSPIGSDERCIIPRNNTKNKNKYILETLKGIGCSGDYICNRDGEFGVWNHKERRYYSYVNQIEIRDEIIEYLFERINRYNYKVNNS